MIKIPIKDRAIMIMRVGLILSVFLLLLSALIIRPMTDTISREVATINMFFTMVISHEKRGL